MIIRIFRASPHPWSECRPAHAVLPALIGGKIMERKWKRLLCLLFAAAMVLGLAACGADSSTSDPNRIQLEEYTLLYKDACIMEDAEGRDALVLTLDYTNNSKTSTTYLWTVTEAATQKGNPLDFVDIITDTASFTSLMDSQMVEVSPGATHEIHTAFVLTGTDPVTIKFEQIIGKKSGKITVDPAALRRQDPVVSPAPADDPLLSWWNGDWYGWWMAVDCTGTYANLEGSWWDCMAEIVIGSDQVGLVKIWDETYSVEQPLCHAVVSLNPAGTGPHGTLYAEAGWFVNSDLVHADWIVDPALAGRFEGYDNVICIDGSYTADDGTSGLTYYIYLRPWGQLWDDIAQEFPDDIPYYYESWYLPLVQAGQSAPERIGPERPADTAAPTIAS